MTHSIFLELTSLTDHDDYHIKKQTELMGIGHIFDYAFHKYHPAGHFKAIVFYCCYTYSWESKEIRIGADWHKQKQRIAHKVGIPDYLMEDVVNLKDQFLSDSFQEFLHLYRDNMDFIHLTSLKDLYSQVMISSTRFQADEAGNTDLNLKFKNIEKATELLQRIKALDQELLDKYRILNSPKGDFRTDGGGEGANPLQFEHSPEIRG